MSTGPFSLAVHFPFGHYNAITGHQEWSFKEKRRSRKRRSRKRRRSWIYIHRLLWFILIILFLFSCKHEDVANWAPHLSLHHALTTTTNWQLWSISFGEWELTTKQFCIWWHEDKWKKLTAMQIEALNLQLIIIKIHMVATAYGQ